MKTKSKKILLKKIRVGIRLNTSAPKIFNSKKIYKRNKKIDNYVI